MIDHSGEPPETLPEELAELFPPEVDAVFPDGLSATIDDWTAVVVARDSLPTRVTGR